MRIRADKIGRSHLTEELYRREEAATESVKQAAKELQRVYEDVFDKEIDFYKEAVPLTIAMLCEAFVGDLELHRRDENPT